MIVFDDIVQGTEEWRDLRRGVPTASRFAEIMKADGSPSASREKYMYELAGEIITGERQESYKNQHMQRGNDREDESRSVYGMATGQVVEQVGFIMHDSGLYGCSPDGLVGDFGGFETKDKLPHLQAAILDNGCTGSEHHRQVHGSMLVTGRQWWDLVYYCRGMKQHIIRFERDEKLMVKMHCALVEFVEELNKTVKRIS